jgi:TPR repeat protein
MPVYSMFLRLRSSLSGQLSKCLAVVGNKRQQRHLARQYASVATSSANSLSAAIAWARRAASDNSPDDLLFLGGLLLMQHDSSGNRDAKCAYEKAANLGSVPSMQALGWCFEQGIGCERNRAESLYWYRRAADGGRSESQLVVARELLASAHSLWDLDTAEHYARLAMGSGSVEAASMLEAIRIRRQDTVK